MMNFHPPEEYVRVRTNPRLTTVGRSLISVTCASLGLPKFFVSGGWVGWGGDGEREKKPKMQKEGNFGVSLHVA